VLGIDDIRQGHGHLAQLVARRVQHFPAEIQQSANTATAERAADIHHTVGGLERQRDTRGLERILLRDERGRIVAQHQRLTIADEDIELTIILADNRGLDLARQVRQLRIARIQQIAWRRAGLGLRTQYFLVQPGDVAGDAIDAGRFAPQLRVDFLFDVVQGLS